MGFPLNRRSLPRPATVMWLVLSWHVISVVIYLSLLVTPVVMTTDVDDDLMAPDNDDLKLQDSSFNESVEETSTKAASCDIDIHKFCPDNQDCSTLRAECIQCEFNHSCVYGSKGKAMCAPVAGVNCTGKQRFEREYECRYCYQLPHWQTWCNQTTDCALNKPRSYYPAKPFFMSTCWAQSKYLCLGRRCFHKQISCNWSNGKKWSTSLLLSIFLGGFGGDRFYLGLWKTGIGKFASLGGLGVWTLVDVILIAVGYIGPWDGSLYI